MEPTSLRTLSSGLMRGCHVSSWYCWPYFSTRSLCFSTHLEPRSKPCSDFSTVTAMYLHMVKIWCHKMVWTSDCVISLLTCWESQLIDIKWEYTHCVLFIMKREASAGFLYSRLFASKLDKRAVMTRDTVAPIEADGISCRSEWGERSRGSPVGPDPNRICTMVPETQNWICTGLEKKTMAYWNINDLFTLTLLNVKIRRK